MCKWWIDKESKKAQICVFFENNITIKLIVSLSVQFPRRCLDYLWGIFPGKTIGHFCTFEAGSCGARVVRRGWSLRHFDWRKSLLRFRSAVYARKSDDDAKSMSSSHPERWIMVSSTYNVDVMCVGFGSVLLYVWLKIVDYDLSWNLFFLPFLCTTIARGKPKVQIHWHQTQWFTHWCCSSWGNVFGKWFGMKKLVGQSAATHRGLASIVSCGSRSNTCAALTNSWTRNFQICSEQRCPIFGLERQMDRTGWSGYRINFWFEVKTRHPMVL